MSEKVSYNELQSLGASKEVLSFYSFAKPRILKEDDGSFNIYSSANLKGLSSSEMILALTELALDHKC